MEKFADYMDDNLDVKSVLELLTGTAKDIQRGKNQELTQLGKIYPILGFQ